MRYQSESRTSKGEGEDITILTIGATLYRALEAADRLYDDYGLAALRSLMPDPWYPLTMKR